MLVISQPPTPNQEKTKTPWPFGTLRPHAYRAVLIDAPYKFSAGPSRNPARHYTTMSVAAIAALPVGELAHPSGCWLFVWTTWPHLANSIAMIDGWGFTYSTGRPWLKTWPSEEDSLFLLPDSYATGTGYVVRNTTEPMLIAKRFPRGVRSGRYQMQGHIIAPRREHSRKPDIVRDEIARLFDGPRCELFARSHHPGFEAWGNQVGMFDGDAL
jgi:N6-adenosine-specific RNA methylase IME4